MDELWNALYVAESREIYVSTELEEIWNTLDGMQDAFGRKETLGREGRPECSAPSNC